MALWIEIKKIELELIGIVDLFQMFENGIRRGLSGAYGDQSIESDNIPKISYVDQTNL